MAKQFCTIRKHGRRNSGQTTITTRLGSLFLVAPIGAPLHSEVASLPPSFCCCHSPTCLPLTLSVRNQMGDQSTLSLATKSTPKASPQDHALLVYIGSSQRALMVYTATAPVNTNQCARHPPMYTTPNVHPPQCAPPPSVHQPQCAPPQCAPPPVCTSPSVHHPQCTPAQCANPV